MTVACSQTVTGTAASVTGTGTTCVQNATISGGITVPAGATLDLENVTVRGSLTLYGAGTVRICGSTFSALSVSATTGFVLIGDPAHGCAANTITGSLVAANNHGGLVIVGNTIAGGLTTSNNSGSGPLPGQGSPVVSGNHQ